MRMDKYTKALLTFNLLAIVGLSIGWYQQAKIVSERGGARLVVKSGGALDVESGGEIDVESGGSLKLAGTAMTSTAAELNVLDGAVGGTITASKVVVVDGSKNIGSFGSVDTGIVTSSALTLESLNPLTVKLNDTDAMKIDNTAIASFAGETDTAGNDVYVETEDAGATPTVARTGGLLNMKTGDGSAGATTVVAGAGGATTLLGGDGGGQTGTVAGGAGGAATLQGGAGGAQSGAGATGLGGAGGAVSVTAGVGGVTDNTGTDAAGAGGPMTLTSGTGGAASGAAASDGGAGGDITLTPGGGGTSANGAAGGPGDVVVSTGVLRFAVQTIDMLNATVTLTLVPGTPTGTLLAGNIMYIDATSGATEDLLLPPEGDCTGLFLVIENTGGETINVQNDAAGAVVTLETANVAYVACDGTTWTGSVAVP